MKKSISISLILISLIFSISCSSNMTMQTAKALPEGKSSMGAAVIAMQADSTISQYSGRPDIEKNDKDCEKCDDKGFFPFAWFLYRHGFGGGVEIGLNLTVYAAEGFLKYQFLKADEFNMAFGLGGYYGYLPDVVYGMPGIHSYDYIFPVYISYDLTEGYSVYGSGKFIKRHLFSKNEGIIEDNYLDNSTRHIVSVTIGNKIRYSEEFFVLFELCVSKDIGLDYFSSQLTLGLSNEY